MSGRLRRWIVRINRQCYKLFSLQTKPTHQKKELNRVTLWLVMVHQDTSGPFTDKPSSTLRALSLKTRRKTRTKLLTKMVTPRLTVLKLKKLIKARRTEANLKKSLAKRKKNPLKKRNKSQLQRRVEEEVLRSQELPLPLSNQSLQRKHL